MTDDRDVDVLASFTITPDGSVVHPARMPDGRPAIVLQFARDSTVAQVILPLASWAAVRDQAQEAATQARLAASGLHAAPPGGIAPQGATIHKKPRRTR